MFTAINRPAARLMPVLGLGTCIVLGGCLEMNRQIRQDQAKAPTNGASSPRAAEATVQLASNPYEAAGSPTRRTNGFNFTQVSLFGDLPGIPATPYKSQSGPSLQQHTFAVEGACFDPAIRADGKTMAFASTQHSLKPDIYLKPVGMTTMTQLTDDPGSEVQPCFNRDGSKVAFASDRTGNWDIYIIDSRNGKLQQVTEDPAPEMHPSFSADERELAYCRYNLRSGQWEVWVVDLGDGQKRFVTAGLFPSFSPKEPKIVYQRAKQRGSRWFSVWTIDLGDGASPMPTEVATAADRALVTPRWSTDGEYVAYCAVRPEDASGSTRPTNDAQIWVVRKDGTGKMPVTDPAIGSFSPGWSADGRIFFCANRGGSENIWSVLPMIAEESRLEANQPTAVAPTDTGEVQHETARVGK